MKDVMYDIDQSLTWYNRGIVCVFETRISIIKHFLFPKSCIRATSCISFTHILWSTWPENTPCLLSSIWSTLTQIRIYRHKICMTKRVRFLSLVDIDYSETTSYPMRMHVQLHLYLLLLTLNHVCYLFHYFHSHNHNDLSLLIVFLTKKKKM